MTEPFKRTTTDRIGNTVFTALAGIGVGPADSLITTGRKTGARHSVPVVPVRDGNQIWIVAPYGPVDWVRNARAAGAVGLKRGRTEQRYRVRELSLDEAGPILKQYVQIAPGARSAFDAKRDDPVSAFVAEAERHPVFALEPIS